MRVIDADALKQSMNYNGGCGICFVYIDDAETIDVVKEAENDGWTCEKKACGSKKLDIKCVCGKNVYLDAMVFPDDTFANRIYCTNCGLSMRSPQTDKYAEWLINSWTKNVQRDGDRNG